MIIVECTQGDDTWHDVRLGIPTASAASRIVTPTGRLSAQREKYLAELLAEWAMGEALQEFGGNEWTQRGTMLEPQAVAFYEFARDAKVSKVGFCYRDDQRLCGASPDGLVGDQGLLECKAPAIQTHVFWLARGVLPPEHAPQCQFSLWVTQRAWLDFLSYHPEMPPLLVRVEPDEGYQAALDNHMPTFIGEMLEGRDRLRAMGVVPPSEEEWVEPEPKYTAMEYVGAG